MHADQLSELPLEVQAFAAKALKEHEINGCVPGCNAYEHIQKRVHTVQCGVKDTEFHSAWDALRNKRWTLPHDEYEVWLDRMLELLNERDFA